MDDQGRAAVPRGPLIARKPQRRALLVLLVVLAVAAVTAAVVLTRGPTAAGPKATRSAAVRPAPAPGAPELLASTASRSDAFDDWTQGGHDAGVRFLAADDAHSGSFSLRVTRGAADTRGPTDHLDQSVPVPTDAPLHVSLFARSAGSAANAVLLQVDTGKVATLALPGGAYDWRRFSLATVVPAGVRSVTVRIVSAAPAQSVEIDDVVVQGTGSSGSQLQNPGFEGNSADLSIENASLLLPLGHGTLDLTTRRSTAGRIDWATSDSTGRVTARGSRPLLVGRASVSLAAVPEGLANLTVRAHFGSLVVQRRTRIVVLPPPPVDGRTAFGVGIHLGGRSSDALRAMLADLAALGVTTVRTDAYWPLIERTRGRYEFPAELDAAIGAMRTNHLKPLLIPGYANPLYDGGRTPSSPEGIAAYARFAAAVAQHFPGADIDVYNEFDFRHNNGTCGRTAECYLRLLQPASAAIRGLHNGALISAPSITGTGIDFDWLRPFLAGGGARSMDALALHPYTQPAAPDTLGPDLDTLRTQLRQAAGRDVPIWFTEIGWSTVPGWVDERIQAEDLIRTMAIALGHGVQRVYWYDAVDDSRLPLDLESNFGLFELPDSFAPHALVPKPAAAAEAFTARELAGCTGEGADAGLPAGVTSARFRCGGEVRRIVWGDPGVAAIKVRGTGVASTMVGARISLAPGMALDLAAGPVLLPGTVQPVAAG